MWTTKNWQLYARIVRLAELRIPFDMHGEMTRIIKEAVYPDPTLVWC